MLGKPEGELVEELLLDHTTENLVTDTPVFYVDRHFDVYPNYETPSESYRLGNLKTDRGPGRPDELRGQPHPRPAYPPDSPYLGNGPRLRESRQPAPIRKMGLSKHAHNRYCRVLSGRG